MAVDLSVFDRIKSKQDYDREEEEFQIRKAALLAQKTGQDPASVKLANEIAKARAAGDTQRINDLMISAKTFDKGVVTDQFGNPIAMAGYGDAVGSIAGTTKAYEANAQNASDLYYDPQTAGAEAKARLQQEGLYRPGIERDIAEEKADAERSAKRQDEFDINEKTLPLISDLRTLNDSSPKGAYSGKMQFIRRLYPGTSPEEASVDLMAQARLDMAAPLAKQLGVNPTDKDFQASLDRIFDMDATREVRAAQIDALEMKARRRQEQIRKDRESDSMAASGPYQTPAKVNPSNIPMDAVRELRANPGSAAQFDEIFGQGASRMVLGK